MPRHCRRDSIFRQRRYADDIVVLCVRWYTCYRPSLRDLTEMMAEPGLIIYTSLALGPTIRTGAREAQGRASTADGQLLASRRNECADSGKCSTSTESSIDKVGRSTSCCGPTAVSPLPKPSFGRPWRPIRGTARERLTRYDGIGPFGPK